MKGEENGFYFVVFDERGLALRFVRCSFFVTGLRHLPVAIEIFP
jgi:hypothetical protein